MKTATGTTSLPIAEFAAEFGSILGRQLAGEDLVLGTLTGSLLGTLALNVGEVIDFNHGLSVGIGIGEDGAALIAQSQEEVWSNFGNELATFTANAAIGSVSSYLALELGEGRLTCPGNFGPRIA